MQHTLTLHNLSGPQETGTDPVFIYIHSGYTLHRYSVNQVNHSRVQDQRQTDTSSSKRLLKEN
jgi:hypothetical protein